MLRAEESLGSQYSDPRSACVALEGLQVLMLAAGYGRESLIFVGRLAISLSAVQYQRFFLGPEHHCFCH